MLSTMVGRMFGETETPSFDVISVTDVYQERKYKVGKWVVTTITGKKYKDASNEGFKKLFKYVSGTNAIGKQVAMTTPMCIFCTPDNPEWTSCKQEYQIGFLLPADSTKDPPKPSSPDISFRETPEATMYVRQFNGFAGEKEIAEEVQKLRSALSQDQYKDGCFYFCGYDPPMKLVNRRNEVWLIKA